VCVGVSRIYKSICRIGRCGLKHPLRRRLEEDGLRGHGEVARRGSVTA
jgi:hypothetical protein